MTQEKVYTGGCQCGAVRFRVVGELGHASICHCRMCQKAFGNYFAPLVDVRYEQLTWTRGEPATYASSEVADRGFCRNCGTPLMFAYRDYPEIALAICSFDRPEEIPVTSQHWFSRRVSGVEALTSLPAAAEDDPEYADVIAEIAATNHQHPDHDTDDWPRP